MNPENKNILFIEPLCKDKEHLSFNSDLINHLKQASQISFCGEKQYLQNIEAELIKLQESYCIQYEKFSIKELIRRYIFIWKTIANNIDRYSTFLFSSFDNTLFSIFSILFFFLGCYKMRKKSNILFIHNNIYSLKKNRLKKYLLKISIKFYNWKCIVLTEKMKMVFEQEMKYNNILLYPHPYYTVKRIEKKNLETIKLILIGRQADWAIKSSFLDNLIDELNKINTKKIELHISTAKQITYQVNFPLYIYPKLSKEEYDQLFNIASFVMFPYNYSDIYRASGVLMDAISFNTSFIAPKVGHFTDFLDCGFFYSNVNEISVILSEILNISSVEYQAFQNQIMKKKKIINQEKSKLLSLL
ncbi:hypothetical protein [Dysgonomonas mossii]|uniref:hypothetical protein n=1 Tax=Dysgonomonas mossii TaxID=163665 RepID=UPI00399430AF